MNSKIRLKLFISKDFIGASCALLIKHRFSFRLEAFDLVVADPSTIHELLAEHLESEASTYDYTWVIGLEIKNLELLERMAKQRTSTHTFKCLCKNYDFWLLSVPSIQSLFYVTPESRDSLAYLCYRFLNESFGYALHPALDHYLQQLQQFETLEWESEASYELEQLKLEFDFLTNDEITTPSVLAYLDAKLSVSGIDMQALSRFIQAFRTNQRRWIQFKLRSIQTRKDAKGFHYGWVLVDSFGVSYLLTGASQFHQARPDLDYFIFYNVETKTYTLKSFNDQCSLESIPELEMNGTN